MSVPEFTVSEPLVTVGYSVLSERIENIKLPSQDQRIEIIIVIQGNSNGSSSTKHLQRNDTTIVYIDSIGVTKSRNYLIDNSKGKYLFFGDDDINWIEDSFWKVVAYFEANPEVDLILGRTMSEDGNLRKLYPKSKKRLHLLNSGKAGTVEMSIRSSSFRAKEVYFDTQFGAGMENYIGDEYIFITDACKNRMKCVYLPISFSIHPMESSGSNFGSQRDRNARIAVLQRVFGKLTPIVKIFFFLKHRKKISEKNNNRFSY
tara:strand:+ start:122 stop:901 length:780 start_codon:yes stop_codon:yes gene_type:complete